MFLMVLLLILLLGCAPNISVDAPGAARYSEYAGTFIAGPLAVLEINAVDEWLALDPPSWTGRPYFVRGDGDSFALALPYQASHQTMTFFRDDHGAVTGVELKNLDRTYDGQRFSRPAGDLETPGLLFLDRKPVAAARAALADSSISLAELHKFAILHLRSHPTRNPDTVAFLQVLSDAHPENAGLLALYGYSLVAVNQRSEARGLLEAALQLDPDNPNAQQALRRLAVSKTLPGEGYRATLPFSLSDAYAQPTEQEIAAVRELWARRDLSVQDAWVVHKFELTLEHGVFEGRIVRHTISGKVHFGAVLVPRDASQPLPVLLDAKSVDTAYSPRDISQGTDTLAALGAAKTGFIVVIPSLRGNQLIVKDQEFTSGGDPSDAWDGATDDTLALLNVVLEITPEADPRRIAIIGTSRGGTVALLAGARDERISLVLNVVGPVDHLEAMNRTEGWTQAEVLADTLSDGTATAEEEGNQTFDHFFDQVLTEDETLQDVRQRLIASSPLYFAQSLPETHSYYGAEDRSVPLANPQKLKARLESLGRLGPSTTVTIFEDAGHDADSLVVRRKAVQRLVKWSLRRELK